MQISNLKSQLQSMVGEKPDGTLKLLPLPKATDEMLAAMDYDAGLAAGLAANTDLYLKNADAADAKEDWDDASYGYQKSMAQHTYQSKVYAYEAAKQSFTLSYGNLYRAVFDQQQILAAACAALTYEQKTTRPCRRNSSSA